MHKAPPEPDRSEGFNPTEVPEFRNAVEFEPVYDVTGFVKSRNWNSIGYWLPPGQGTPCNKPFCSPIDTLQ